MGLAPFSMFEITARALVIALLGCAFMLLFARRWLPARETLTQQFSASADRLFVRPRQQALQRFLQIGGVCGQVYRADGVPLG